MYTSASATGSTSLVSSWLADGAKLELNTLLLVSTLWPPVSANSECAVVPGSPSVLASSLGSDSCSSAALRRREIISAATPSRAATAAPTSLMFSMIMSTRPGSTGAGFGGATTVRFGLAGAAATGAGAAGAGAAAAADAAGAEAAGALAAGAGAG